MNEKIKKGLNIFLNVAIGILVGLILLAIVGSFLDKKQEKQEFNPFPANKNSAIIKIERKGGGSCTAFVISDNTAITAAHCMRVGKNDLPEIEKTIKKNKEILSKIAFDIQDIKDRCPPSDPQCPFILNNAMLAFNKVFNEINRLKALRVDEFNIKNSQGKDMDNVAIAEYRTPGRRDIGILSGDFKKFEKLAIDRGFRIKRDDKLKICGFPSATFDAICTDFTAMNSYFFEPYALFVYKGEGMLVPGMSGGPVLDKDGVAVGIAFGVNEDFVMFTPTTGIMDGHGERGFVK